MADIQKQLDKKADQWRLGAMVCNANHGAAGGLFIEETWANGETMVKPDTTWATSLNAIPLHIKLQIERNGWVIPVSLIPPGKIGPA